MASRNALTNALKPISSAWFTLAQASGPLTFPWQSSGTIRHSTLLMVCPLFKLYMVILHAILAFSIDDACPVTDLTDWLTERKTVMQHIQQNLSRAQHRMKMQADKNRVERSFQVGDWVYVKLQPYVQQSV